MEEIKELPAWRDWMINWVVFDDKDRMYYVYEPDNHLLCKTYIPSLALESFKYTTFK